MTRDERAALEAAVIGLGLAVGLSFGVLLWVMG